MFKTRITLVVLAAAVAAAAFSAAAQAGTPRLERLTTTALAKTPSQPIYVATRSTFAEAEAKCLGAGGTWTVKMEGGEKVGRCDYTWCTVKPGGYQILKWKVFVVAVCQDQYFKFSLSKGAHY